MKNQEISLDECYDIWAMSGQSIAFGDWVDLVRRNGLIIV